MKIMNLEEAKERIKDLIHTCDEGIGKHGMHEDCFLKDKKALEAILVYVEEYKGRLETKQLIIDQLTKFYVRGLQDLNKRLAKEEIRCNGLQSKLDITNAEILELNATINKMIKWIADNDIDEDFCDTRVNKGKIICDKKCDECVKEYYRKLGEN